MSNLIRVVQSKIVKKDNKYQVQSEKGKNLGTYDTKEQAEKRLKQVEMFKHMKKKSNLFKDFIIDLGDNVLDWVIDKIDYEELKVRIYSEPADHLLTILLDFDLENFVEGKEPADSPYSVSTPEDYYGWNPYYEDFFINKITVIDVDGQKTNIDIPTDTKFGKAIYDAVRDYYTTSEDYFPQSFED